MLESERIKYAIGSFGGAWASTSAVRAELGYPPRQELLGKLYELTSGRAVVVKSEEQQLFWRLADAEPKGHW
jgi:hypothetical protein